MFDEDCSSLSAETHGYIQYGLQWQTQGYTERKIRYANEPVIYYQFATDGSGRAIRVVPDGCVDLLFRCDPSRPSALACGTVLKGTEISLEPNAVYFGVRLSYGLSLLLPGLPPKEIVDVQAPFEDALSQYADMAAKLAGRASFPQRIALFERDGLRLVTGDVRAAGIVGYCLATMHRTGGSVTVRELAADTGYSERYLRTKFEHSLGFPPKLYNRIVRFQQALEGVVRGVAPLSDVAAGGGYFDQAHFMKDFKSFSLMTPSQIRSMITAPRT
ncbi:helix-turn-helix domain-containing protein [Cohnella suwonensis]|uniref:Helix-turn-helix domain-containing protein n=1 Tax=Cohnella suwonensis TaxID=696072 RepID=A0ABW0LSC5_9BACL